MLNSLTKINIEEKIAKLIGKKALFVDFSESRVIPSSPYEVSIMQKADGTWFDVCIDVETQSIAVSEAC